MGPPGAHFLIHRIVQKGKRVSLDATVIVRGDFGPRHMLLIAGPGRRLPGLENWVTRPYRVSKLLKPPLGVRTKKER